MSRTDHMGRPGGCRRSAGRAASQSFRTRSQGQSGMDRWKAKTIQLDRREQRTIQLGSSGTKNDPVGIAGKKERSRDKGTSGQRSHHIYILASQLLVEGAGSFLSKANILITIPTKHIFSD